MERLKAIVRLTRPRHTAQIVGIVAILSITSHGISMQSIYAIIASLLASIAIFLFDDAHDYESDRAVHPERAVPKGYISIRQAYTAGIILLSTATVFASLLLLYQFATFLVFATVAAAIVFLRLSCVTRAILTASVIGAAFPFGAFPDLRTLLFGLIVALPHLGGTIAKDFIHSTGDQNQGLEPPPNLAKYLASAAFFLTGFVLWVPPVLDFVTWLYIPPIIFTHVSCMVLGANILRDRYEKVYLYGGIGMCGVLTAFLITAT